MTSRFKGYVGQRFCDNSTKASEIKSSVAMGGGVVKKFPNLRGVIYGRPLISRCSTQEKKRLQFYRKYVPTIFDPKNLKSDIGFLLSMQ